MFGRPKSIGYIIFSYFKPVAGVSGFHSVWGKKAGLLDILRKNNSTAFRDFQKFIDVMDQRELQLV